MVRSALFITFLFASLVSIGQKTTIINHYEGDETGADERKYVLRTTEEHTVVINYYEIADEGDEGRMRALIADALDFYVDRSVLLENDRIELKNKPALMLKDLDAIVNDAIRYYHFREELSFEGFSPAVLNKLEELNGKAIDKNWDPEFQGGPLLDKTFAFIEKEVNELKQLLRAEVGMFAEGNLWVQVDSQEKMLEEEQQRMLAEVRDFKKGDALSTVEVAFSDETLNLLATEDNFILPTFDELPKSGTLDPDLAEKILAMLEENRDRIDELAGEVDALRQEKSNSPDALSEEVAELKALVISLMEEIRSGGSVTSKPTISLPPSFSGFDVRFASGAVYLTTEAKLQLSELIEVMAANPEYKVMLTGFADKVGSPEANLRISKNRAESVRYHLKQSGIASHRILVNYFGESKATGGASDRRVEIKLLPGS